MMETDLDLAAPPLKSPFAPTPGFHVDTHAVRLPANLADESARMCAMFPRFREATFGSSIILFLRTHCAIDFLRVSPLYFRSSH